jgi:hypothetical protein
VGGVRGQGLGGGGGLGCLVEILVVGALHGFADPVGDGVRGEGPDVVEALKEVGADLGTVFVSDRQTAAAFP